ncbi:MAG: GWxTD domain-containing protein [Ignavibacteria bacterium]
MSVTHKFLILFFLITSLTFSQQKDKSSQAEDFFNFDALNFYSNEGTKSRLDVYIEIPFDKISFVKSKEGKNFISEIDVSLNIKDMGSNPVFSKVYKEVITTEKTELEYLSRNSQIITKNVFLNPGRYIVKLTCKELNSKKLLEKEREVIVKEFQALPITISDVMIVSKLVESQGKKFITPLVSRNAGALDTIHLFFFVYLNSEASSLEVKCKISNSKNEEFYTNQQLLDAKTGPELDNQIIFSVPTNNFSNDSYKIDLTASTPNNTAASVSELEFRWAYFPVNIDDIDLAIGQLQYIATDDELGKIRKAKTPADKQKRLIEFWKSKDPSPNTTRNEVMNEYYKRIEYANKTYSTHYTDGWKTDMGMVYIIFGLPSNIERHPYEMDTKPYEVWDYYDINRQFVFVDNSGFGDYRLITPIWDTFRYKN